MVRRREALEMRLELLEEQMKALRGEFVDDGGKSRGRSRSKSCCRRGRISRSSSLSTRYNTSSTDGTIHVSRLPKKKVPRRTRPWCPATSSDIGVPSLKEDPPNTKVKQHSLLWDRLQSLSAPSQYYSYDDYHHNNNYIGNNNYVDDDYLYDMNDDGTTFRQGWTNNLNTPPKDCVLVSEVYPRLVAVSPPAIPPMGAKQEVVSSTATGSPRTLSPQLWADPNAIQLSPSRKSRNSAPSPAPSPRASRSVTPQPHQSPPKATKATSIAVGTDDAQTSIVVSCQTSDTLLKMNESPRSSSPPLSPKRENSGPIVSAARSSYITTAPPVIRDSYKRPPHLNVDRPRSGSLVSSRRPSVSSFVKSPSAARAHSDLSRPPSRANSVHKAPPEGSSSVKQPTVRRTSLVGIRRVSIGGSTPPGTPVSMKAAPLTPSRTPPSPYMSKPT